MEFACYYEGLRYFLDYVLDEDKMPIIYRSIKVEYDKESGEFKGEALMEQYAISGQGRTLDPVPIEPDFTELDLRGVEEFGLFGPLSEKARYLRQIFEVYLEEKAHEGEEEEEEEELEGIVDNFE